VSDVTADSAAPSRLAGSTVALMVFVWVLTGLLYAALMWAAWVAVILSGFQNSWTPVPGWAEFAYFGLYFTPLFAPFLGAIAVYRSRTRLPLRRFGTVLTVLGGASWGWLIGFIATVTFIPGIPGSIAMFAGFILGGVLARLRVHFYNQSVAAIPA